MTYLFVLFVCLFCFSILKKREMMMIDEMDEMNNNKLYDMVICKTISYLLSFFSCFCCSFDCSV